MASGVYNGAKGHNATLDWSAGGQTFRAILLNSTHTFNPDHDFVSDISANEMGGAGRVDVTGRSVTISDASDRADHDGNNVTFGAVTGTAQFVVVYKFGTGDADSRLICCIDFGAQVVAAVAITVKWNSGASSGTVFRGT